MPKADKTKKEKEAGVVTHYYDKIGVAVVKIKTPLKLGELVVVRRGEHEFEHAIVEMQVDHKDIAAAKKGQEVGMKMSEPTKPGSKLFKLA